MPNTTTSRPYTTPSIGMAACALDASAAASGARVQIFPLGEFRSGDGRPTDCAAYRMTRAAAERLRAAVAARTADVPFDYEHQTLNALDNGKPAPAAGWFHGLEIDATGVYATGVKWTPAAQQMIESGEYRYCSPLFRYDQRTGEILKLINVALTNTPALDGMQALAACAARFMRGAELSPGDTPMNELLAAVRSLFNLPEAADEKAALAACSSLHESLGEAAKQKDFSLTAYVEALAKSNAESKTQIAALGTQLGEAKTAAPDPAKYVPMAELTKMQGQVAALSQQMEEREKKEMLEAALKDGRVLDVQKDYWAKQPIAALSEYLKTAQPIAALVATQTGGKAPQGGVAGLSAMQAEVARNLGLDPKKFAEFVAAQQAAA